MFIANFTHKIRLFSSTFKEVWAVCVLLPMLVVASYVSVNECQSVAFN